MNITYTNTLTPEEYNALHQAAGWNKCKPERIRMALARSDFLTVARAGKEAVGMARVMHDGLQALVMDVIVKPEYQGQGIGKAMMWGLMAYLKDLARDGGIKVNLMTAPDKVGFYEQFGFTKRPTDALGPGMTILVKEEKTI